VSGAWSSSPTNACTSALRLKFGKGSGSEDRLSENNDALGLGATQTSTIGLAFVE
tara:strand:- start:613 stop:777 length:165 start_codon:yes stop_codon:yes gene_type:complete